MKNVYIIGAIMLLTQLSGFTQVESQDDEKIGQLEGTWVIDLRPTPVADEYLKEFDVDRVEGSTFTGTFYGSDFEDGLINGNWQKIYFAFQTRDQHNEYFHSAYLLNDTIHGISYCPGRKFVAPWTGTKKED